MLIANSKRNQTVGLQGVALNDYVISGKALVYRRHRKEPVVLPFLFSGHGVLAHVSAAAYVAIGIVRVMTAEVVQGLRLKDQVAFTATPRSDGRVS